MSDSQFYAHQLRRLAEHELWPALLAALADLEGALARSDRPATQQARAALVAALAAPPPTVASGAADSARLIHHSLIRSLDSPLG